MPWCSAVAREKCPQHPGSCTKSDRLPARLTTALWPLGPKRATIPPIRPPKRAGSAHGFAPSRPLATPVRRFIAGPPVSGQLVNRIINPARLMAVLVGVLCLIALSVGSAAADPVTAAATEALISPSPPAPANVAPRPRAYL